MELRHLRYFMAAAEDEHFGRAADRLHVTRPAVSQIVADLESELDTELFERSSARVRLTAAGRAFLPRVQAIMKELHEAVTLARQVGQGRTGALDIGFSGLALAHPLFRAAIGRLRERCPDVTVSLFEMPSGEQPAALASGRIHAGFLHVATASAPPAKMPAPPASPEAECAEFRIQTGGLGVAVARDHPLAHRRSLSLAELRHEHFVVVTCSSVNPSFGRLLLMCQKAGFEPRIVREVDAMAGQLNLVSIGAGVGLIVTGPHYRHPENVAVIPLTDVDYSNSFSLRWLPGCREPALPHLVGIVRELALAQHAAADHAELQDAREDAPGDAPPATPPRHGAERVVMLRPGAVRAAGAAGPVVDAGEPALCGPVLLSRIWHGNGSDCDLPDRPAVRR